jgi:hypothetical protein
MLFIVNTHFQVGKILVLIRGKFDLAWILVDQLSLVVKTFAEQFILIVNDKMIRTVGEGHHRSVRQTPAKAPSNRDDEGQLIVLKGKLGDVEDMGVEARYFL